MFCGNWPQLANRGLWKQTLNVIFSEQGNCNLQTIDLSLSKCIKTSFDKLFSSNYPNANDEKNHQTGI
jgi:hypothetical protein